MNAGLFERMGGLVTCDEYETPKKPFPNDPFHTWETYMVGWFLVTVFAILATAYSTHLIYMHLTHYRRPEFQRPINRILLMVPVYAIISALSYRFYRKAVFFHVIRDAYEAFVIWCFFGLLLQYLGPDFRSQRAVFQGKQRRRLPPPACFFTHDPGWRHFLHSCKFGIVQYIVVRVTTTIAAVVLELNNMYCPESMSPSFGHFWMTLLNAVSVGLAMFTLFTFYLAVSSDLSDGARRIGSSAHPVAQFLSIKFVIFFGFWQGIVVRILVSQGSLHGTDTWTAGEVSNAVQSFLVCLEMFIASILHNWAFSWRDFENAGDPEVGGTESLETSEIRSSSETSGSLISPFVVEDDMSLIQEGTAANNNGILPRRKEWANVPRPVTPFWASFRDSFNWFDLYTDLVIVVKFVAGRAWSILKRVFEFIICRGRRRDQVAFEEGLLETTIDEDN